VAVFGSYNRSDENQLVGNPGEAGKVLADVNARNVGLNGLELPSNF
jgi:hypothetical protein